MNLNSVSTELEMMPTCEIARPRYKYLNMHYMDLWLRPVNKIMFLHIGYKF